MYKQGDECVLPQDSAEYSNMEAFCKILNNDSPNKYHYRVGETYLDFGQNWVWTTILNDTTGGQVLTPREWLDIVNGENLFDLAKEHFADKYCQDRIRN